MFALQWRWFEYADIFEHGRQAARVRRVFSGRLEVSGFSVDGRLLIRQKSGYERTLEEIAYVVDNLMRFLL